MIHGIAPDTLANGRRRLHLATRVLDATLYSTKPAYIQDIGFLKMYTPPSYELFPENEPPAEGASNYTDAAVHLRDNAIQYAFINEEAYKIDNVDDGIALPNLDVHLKLLKRHIKACTDLTGTLPSWWPPKWQMYGILKGSTYLYRPVPDQEGFSRSRARLATSRLIDGVQVSYESLAATAVFPLYTVHINPATWTKVVEFAIPDVQDNLSIPACPFIWPWYPQNEATPIPVDELMRYLDLFDKLAKDSPTRYITIWDGKKTNLANTPYWRALESWLCVNRNMIT